MMTVSGMTWSPHLRPLTLHRGSAVARTNRTRGCRFSLQTCDRAQTHESLLKNRVQFPTYSLQQFPENLRSSLVNRMIIIINNIIMIYLYTHMYLFILFIKHIHLSLSLSLSLSLYTHMCVRECMCICLCMCVCNGGSLSLVSLPCRALYTEPWRPCS